MIRATRKTIRDYWRLQGLEAQPAVHKASSPNGFHRVMASAMETDHRNNHPTHRGLTIQDYWRQAVPSKGYTPLSPSADTSRPTPTAPDNTTARPVDERQESTVVSDKGEQSARRTEIDQAIVSAAGKYGLPAELITSVIRHESNFDPRAVSSAGAQGLMQLMPATARELGVDDPFDVRQNIDGGARYLKQMLTQFDGDMRQALAAYNAGPGTVRRYGGIPPYPETLRYVRKVMASAAETA